MIVLKFLNLVLKKYGKRFLKMCGNPIGFCCERISYVKLILATLGFDKGRLDEN